MISRINEPSETVVPADYFNPSEGAVGDFKATEVLCPYLSIVHGVGDLAETFKAGSLVYNKETVLEQPLPLTVFGYKKWYAQNIEFGSEERPVILDTEAQVLASGGNLDYGKKGGEDPNNFYAGMTAKVLFQLPDESTLGALDFEGQWYARAQWVVKKTAYSDIVRHLNFAASALTSRKLPLSTQKWVLRVEREPTKSGNKVWKPKLSAKGTNSPEFVQFVRSLF